ncbi:MAG: inositol monophosphatase [Alistipes sp.]|nr:inositol monophosphatase [Candidatus Alistipes equi]
MKENCTLEQVIQVVKDASPLMVESFEIEEKIGGAVNLVTTSDNAVQKFLYEHLTALLPGSGFFGEEVVTPRTDAEYVWVVDPIDGTSNYARSDRDCAISVALKRDDELLMGVVYSPARGELYSAEKGKGAFLNGKKISVSKRTSREALLFTAMSIYYKEYAGLCAAVMEEGFRRFNDIRRYGSAAVEICQLARGYAEMYFELRLNAWDYAASMLILTEAGGYVSDHDGVQPSLTGSDMICCANSKENLSELLQIIKKHIVKLPYTKS